MFGRKRDEKPVKSLNIDSLIGEDIKLIGKIEGSGNLRIDGTIEGDINYNGDITLGESGKVEGNILCENLIVAGNIEGDLNIKESLTLLPTGVLYGDIKVKSLVIHEKARFEGSCEMIKAQDKVRPLDKEKNQEISEKAQRL